MNLSVLWVEVSSFRSVLRKDFYMVHSAMILPTDLLSLEGKLGYRFQNTGLLLRAFREKGSTKSRNESFDILEKVGDTVLKAATVSLLMQRFPHADVGEISRMESLITCNDNLAHVSTRLGLHETILRFTGGGALTRKILADTVEAILGAVALDAGEKDLTLGIPKVLEICKKIFWVELEISQIADPEQRLHRILSQRGVSQREAHYYIFNRRYKNSVIGMVCKYQFKSKKLKSLFGCDNFVGTGYSSDAALSKTCALLVLHLERGTRSNTTPSLQGFSWKIKQSF